MKAEVKTYEKLSQIIRPLEKEVKKEMAQRIYAVNFAKDIKKLTQKDILTQFLRFTNSEAIPKTEIVHLILSFDLACIFDNESLKALVVEYMTEIELHKQPFLIYGQLSEIHIVTPKKNNLFGQFTSTTILAQVERNHILRSSGLPVPNVEWKIIGPGEPIAFGRTYSHTTFNIDLPSIVCRYSYTSLEGLNAALQYYDMFASIEEEATSDSGKRQLVYYRLGENGEKIEPGINASELLESLDLEYFERRCDYCRTNISCASQPLMGLIDNILSVSPMAISDFIKKMAWYRKSCSFQYDNEGRLQNIWYVDRETKFVIDGASLGDNYTAESIIQKCST